MPAGAVAVGGGIFESGGNISIQRSHPSDGDDDVDFEDPMAWTVVFRGEFDGSAPPSAATYAICSPTTAP